jgi:hypothetical protein
MKFENAFFLYRNLATAYVQKQAGLFDEIANGNIGEFVKDNNFGLL